MKKLFQVLIILLTSCFAVAQTTVESKTLRLINTGTVIDSHLRTNYRVYYLRLDDKTIVTYTKVFVFNNVKNLDGKRVNVYRAEDNTLYFEVISNRSTK